MVLDTRVSVARQLLPMIQKSYWQALAASGRTEGQDEEMASEGGGRNRGQDREIKNVARTVNQDGRDRRGGLDVVDRDRDHLHDTCTAPEVETANGETMIIRQLSTRDTTTAQNAVSIEIIRVEADLLDEISTATAERGGEIQGPTATDNNAIASSVLVQSSHHKETQ